MMESISPEQLKTLFAEQQEELKRKLGLAAFKELMSSENGRSFIRETAADQASIRVAQLMGLHTEDEAELICEIILRYVAK